MPKVARTPVLSPIHDGKGITESALLLHSFNIIILMVAAQIINQALKCLQVELTFVSGA